MTADSPNPAKAPLILPADPLGAGLTVIDVEKAEPQEKGKARGSLNETTRKPYKK